MPSDGAKREFFLQYVGAETDLIFNKGIDLPGFASFPLVETEEGRSLIEAYYDELIAIGREAQVGVLIDSMTWVANPDRAAPLGYDVAALDAINARAAALASQAAARAGDVRTIVSGQVGPRADGYAPGSLMSAQEAQTYHAAQIGSLHAGGAEIISAFTMGYADEAIGIARASQEQGLPVSISFTVETDGRLPTGASLREAVEAVDEATDGAPVRFLVNCAHPDHARPAWGSGEWMGRVEGLVANASRCSHAELDEASALDDGNPEELGAQLGELAHRFAHFTVFGGCCGTDMRHIRQIANNLRR